MQASNNILGTIGNTPLVKINHLCTNPNVDIYAKIEGVNPSGSIKDRIALKMIEQAEHEGELTPGKTIIEPTSGNTGIALAMIGTIKGYDVEVVMSAAVSTERVNMLKAYGAKVILTQASQGTDGAIRKARKMVLGNPDKYFMPDQFSNRYNKVAHYSTTAEEMIRDTVGRITHFVSALGTSGTLMGTAKRLKELNPAIKVVEAHPEKGHYIQGLKNMEEAICPDIYDPSKIDISIMIDSGKALQMARRIVREEGIFCGMSSGAAMIASLEVAKMIERGVIVCIFPDRGEKYLSTPLFA
ncbi:MAG: cysteine synthase [Clostridia bacterium]|jgi:S-sulfo-L-cysteine synthase (O-acetyl-L-serine-dependent)|nr:cysteine synthase [Clostridia bacterium]MBT7121844.1 cysteine synthase [Clostridia bacterium]